jgi:hypothetical protein
MDFEGYLLFGVDADEYYRTVKVDEHGNLIATLCVMCNNQWTPITISKDGRITLAFKPTPEE